MDTGTGFVHRISSWDASKILHRVSPAAAARIERAFRGLRGRVSRLPFRLILGAGLLVSSLGLGLWAQELAGAESLRQWLLDHPPDPQVWKHAMESRGLGAPKKPGALNGALRSLPLSVDDRGSSWVSEEGVWIAVFKPDSPATPALIRCLRCDRPPRRWEPLGTGWPALEQAISWLDTRLKSVPKPIPGRKKAAEWNDPRAIHY